MEADSFRHLKEAPRDREDLAFQEFAQVIYTEKALFKRRLRKSPLYVQGLNRQGNSIVCYGDTIEGTDGRMEKQDIRVIDFSHIQQYRPYVLREN